MCGSCCWPSCRWRAAWSRLFGLFGWIGIPLNPANLIVLPLILGIGIDDGVHIVHDFLHSQATYRMSPSTAAAVVLTSATTMVGFGSMMIASHQGLRSLGQVLTLGVFLCLLTSLVTLPAALAIISRRRRAAVSEAEWPQESEPQSPSGAALRRPRRHGSAPSAPAVDRCIILLQPPIAGSANVHWSPASHGCRAAPNDDLSATRRSTGSATPCSAQRSGARARNRPPHSRADPRGDVRESSSRSLAAIPIGSALDGRT